MCSSTIDNYAAPINRWHGAALGPVLLDDITARLATDGHHSDFLGSVNLAARMRVVDPSVPLGSIDALRAAYAAKTVSPVHLP
jgi:hypothetical protein